MKAAIFSVFNFLFSAVFYTSFGVFDLLGKILYKAYINAYDSFYCYQNKIYEDNFSFRVHKAISKLIALDVFTQDDFKDVKFGICETDSYHNGNYIYLSISLFSKPEEEDRNKIISSRRDFNLGKSYVDNNQLATDIAILLKKKKLNDYFDGNLSNSYFMFSHDIVESFLDEYFVKILPSIFNSESYKFAESTESIVATMLGDNDLSKYKDYDIVTLLKNYLITLVDYVSFLTVPFVAKPLSFLINELEELVVIKTDHSDNNTFLSKISTFFGDIGSTILHCLEYVGIDLGGTFRLVGSKLSEWTNTLLHKSHDTLGAVGGAILDPFKWMFNKFASFFEVSNSYIKDGYCKLTKESEVLNIISIDQAKILLNKLAIIQEEDLSSLGISVCSISKTKLSANNKNIYLSSDGFEYDQEIQERINQIKKNKINDLKLFNDVKNYNDQRDLAIEIAMKYQEAQYINRGKNKDFLAGCLEDVYKAVYQSISTNELYKEPLCLAKEEEVNILGEGEL